MKFNIKYVDEIGNFRGKGAVFINDTALIFKGNIPKFDIFAFAGSAVSRIINQIYAKVLYVSTSRTIPYTTIVKYKKPSGFNQSHAIHYKLPNDQKVIIGFKMIENNEIFTSKLEEYLAIVQSFVDS